METNAFAILQKRIRSGEYHPGDWLASERSLAAELGVNRRTIHRAIDRLTEAGLIVRQPGYRPVIATQTSVTPHPPTIAFLMGNEPMYHAFQLVLHGCEPVLRAAGYRILFMDTWGQTFDTCQRREQEALASLQEHPVDGLIVWCQSTQTAAEQLRLLSDQGVPSVLIDREVAAFDADFVGIDNIEAARIAVDHLLTLGHRRIAFAMGPESTSPVLDRESGYRQALLSHGIPVDESMIYRFDTAQTELEAKSMAADIAERADRPTAVFAVNDLLALRLTRCLVDIGLRVPGDMAIVGFDDVESHAVQEPFLTTMRQPYESMGRHAARLIVQRLATPDVPIRHVLLETALVRRRSTMPNPAIASIADQNRLAVPATSAAHLQHTRTDAPIAPAGARSGE